MQIIKQVKLHLGDICIDGVVNDLEGNVHVSDEELLFVIDIEYLKMLHCTVHH